MKELMEALALARKGFGKVNRDATGQIQNRTYKYATLGSVMDAIREPLADNGLQLYHFMTDGVLFTVLWHTPEQELSSSIKIELDDDPQAVGKSITYYMRYNINMLLGLVSEDDTDGSGGSGRRPPPREPQQPADPTKTLSPANRAHLATALECQRSELLVRASEDENSGAPQDDSSMYEALKAAVYGNLGVAAIFDAQVDDALKAIGLAVLNADGSISIEVVT